MRSQQHPWGFPSHGFKHERRRMEDGNEFIHFTIRAIITAQTCKRQGERVMTVLEHPEDLGRLPKGVPGSTWQLQEIRKAFAEFPCITVAGHEWHFLVNDAKPTRPFSDIRARAIWI